MYLGLVQISGEPAFDYLFSVVIQVVLAAVGIAGALSLLRR